MITKTYLTEKRIQFTSTNYISTLNYWKEKESGVVMNNGLFVVKRKGTQWANCAAPVTIIEIRVF